MGGDIIPALGDQTGVRTVRGSHACCGDQVEGRWAWEGCAGWLTHHLSCCRPLVRLWASSPIRSSAAPATCCSKAPPSPPMLRLQRGGWRDTLRLGGRPKHPPHSTPARTSSHSPPLAVKILGPVGDVERLVPLASLLPPPLGSSVGSWLLPLPADNFREDVLADRGPASPAAPREQTGLPTCQPSWGLGPGASGTLHVLIRTQAPAEAGLAGWGRAGCRPG